jgi:integrase/recombinase XerD
MPELLTPPPNPETTAPELQGRELQPLGPAAAPCLFALEPRAAKRFWEFFTAQIPNDHTRRAYYHAVSQFSAWCALHGIEDLAQVQPIHVAAWVKESGESRSRPTVKQHLAAVRMLFDWLVTGQVIPVNPAHAVRGPKHIMKRGKTPVLASDEMRDLLDSIPTTSVLDLRDRALLGTMAYTFARIGAVLSLKVEDYYVQKRRGWIRLHEKGGKVHEVPCHHNLEKYLEEYLQAAGIGTDPEGPLFRAWRNGQLQRKALHQSNVHKMIRRRARLAGIRTKIGCHSFRATGITNYLKNGGRLEVAQQMAGHESSRTTGLYDRRGEEISLDEVERISY